jgi:uncharacterized protein (DUF1778 family)
MTTTRTARLEARVSLGLSEKIKRAAEIQGLTKTGFIANVLQKEAERVIQEQTVLNLSLQDQERFAQAILNPPEPNPALKRAFNNRNTLLEIG